MEQNKKKASSVRRKNIRFLPDEGTYALIDLNAYNKKFEPTVPALILNESYGGCSLVITNFVGIKQDDHVLVQLGKLAPLKAVVRWKKELDPKIIQIGLAFED